MFCRGRASGQRVNLSITIGVSVKPSTGGERGCGALVDLALLATEARLGPMSDITVDVGPHELASLTTVKCQLSGQVVGVECVQIYLDN